MFQQQIPYSEVTLVYSIQEVLCVLLVLLLLILAIFELKFWVKLLTSLTSLAVLALHYWALTLLTRYENVVLLPLLVLESGRTGFAAVSPDYGQLMILLLIVLWRRELYPWFKRVVAVFKAWLK